MPLTPADIHNVAFRKSSLGKRGYDEEQVDALLDEVTQQMIQLLEENDVLQRRADHSGASGSAAEDEFSAVTAELGRVRRACDQAEQNARLLQGQLDQARRAATAESAPQGESTDRVLAMAQRTADDHQQDAYQHSHTLLSDAQEQSEQIVREARLAGDDIDRDSRRRHRESIAELQVKRTALLREIEGLAQRAEHYHAALENDVIRQGKYLDGTPGIAGDQQPS